MQNEAITLVTDTLRSAGAISVIVTSLYLVSEAGSSKILELFAKCSKTKTSFLKQKTNSN